MQALFLFLFFLHLFLLICANYCIILYISSLARGCSILNRSSGWYIISPDVPVLYLFEARPTFTFFFSLPLQPVKAACTIYKYSFISPSSLDPFLFFIFSNTFIHIHLFLHIHTKQWFFTTRLILRICLLTLNPTHSSTRAHAVTSFRSL